MNLRAEHYAGCARYALAQAKSFRDESRRTGIPADRWIMRGFALLWRDYRQLTAAYAAQPPASHFLHPAS